jgi:general stress protein 26
MMPPEYLLEVAKATIRATSYYFLITLGDTGQAHARLMQPFAPKEDLTIWSGASPKSRKIRDIRQDRQVTLAFHDPADTAYVALVGSAQVEDDLNERLQRWREEWGAFFPAGPAGDDYGLIHCIPWCIELMNLARHVHPDPFGLRHAVLVRPGVSWVVEEGSAP